MNSTVAKYPEIMSLTADAWFEVDARTFQASWITTGYFEASHFLDVANTPVASVESLEEAHKVLDPTGLLAGTALSGTPQYCTTFEWRIQEIRWLLCVHC